MKSRITKFYRISFLLIILVGVQVLPGCNASNAAKGAAIGTGSGAVIGGVIGKESGNTALGALIGAVVGGGTGAIIGRHMDKQAAELRADLKGATVERVGEGIKITFDSGLMFDYNSQTLTPATKANLTSLAKTLNKYPDTDILVEGHTDKTGSNETNMTLSKARGQAVTDFLVQNKVLSSRISTHGYGEEQLISENDQANRRVEVAISANKKMKKAARKGEL
jgi:outer membrane protein OmpA-like peptidoglycan-associated protein